jgi:hypothetical protein
LNYWVILQYHVLEDIIFHVVFSATILWLTLKEFWLLEIVWLSFSSHWTFDYHGPPLGNSSLLSFIYQLQKHKIFLSDQACLGISQIYYCEIIQEVKNPFFSSKSSLMWCMILSSPSSFLRKKSLMHFLPIEGKTSLSNLQPFFNPLPYFAS